MSVFIFNWECKGKIKFFPAKNFIKKPCIFKPLYQFWIIEKHSYVLWLFNQLNFRGVSYKKDRTEILVKQSLPGIHSRGLRVKESNQIRACET